MNNNEYVEMLDSFTIHVTVNMVSIVDEVAPTSTPAPAYDPVANGYTEKAGEWQYGENVTVSLWWNGKEDKASKSQVLVAEGTGRMWTTAEAKVLCEEYDNGAPWRAKSNKKGDYIHEVYVGEGITFVAGFSLLEKLTKVSLPSTLTEIGPGAFGRDYSLIEISLPKGLKIVGSGAFEGCDFYELTIPSTVTYIGNNAFSGATLMQYQKFKNHLQEVVIPSSVLFIDLGGFRYRDGLTIQVEGEHYKNFAEYWNVNDATSHTTVYK